MSAEAVMQQARADAKAILDAVGERLAELIDKDPHVKYDAEAGQLRISPRLEAYARTIIAAEGERVLREEQERHEREQGAQTSRAGESDQSRLGRLG